MSNFETTGRIWMVCNVPTQQEKTHMSEQFDISTNRVQHGLLEPAEREAIEAAAKVPGARVEYWTTFYGKSEWRPWVDSPGVRPANVTFRVHLPAAVEPKAIGKDWIADKEIPSWGGANTTEKLEPPKQEPKQKRMMVSALGEIPHEYVKGDCEENGCIEVDASGKPADSAPAAAPVETWEHEGKRYKLVPGPTLDRCDGCALFNFGGRCPIPGRPSCNARTRADGKNMIFVEDAPAPVPPDAPKPTRIEPLVCEADGDASLLMMIRRLNEIINAVNELRGAK